MNDKLKTTTVHVDSEVYEHLLRCKKIGDTFNDVLRRLLLVNGDFQVQALNGGKIFKGTSKPSRFDDGTLGFFLDDEQHKIRIGIRLTPQDEQNSK